MPTERSNVVTITDDSNTITGISFVENSIVISDGQPSKKSPNISQKGNVFKIELKAGRHKSEPVAKQFNAASGGEVHEYAPSGGGGTPDELNFFFEVTLNFQASDGTTGSANVYLGQGSFGGSINNWWIGGGIVYNNNGSAELHAPVGNNIVILPLSGDHDSFQVKLGRTHKAYPIEHVFVLMLENHSFDNIFAMSGIAGITAATTSNSNSSNGVTYNVINGAPTSMPTDPGHEFTDVVEQLAGSGAKYPSGGPYPSINNSGFASNYATTTTEGSAPDTSEIGDIMAAFNTSTQLPVIYQLATEFVLCDHWFSSIPGPTWPNRYFIHGASSAGLDHSPSKSEMTKFEVIGLKYPNGSIYDALNNNNVPWRLYGDFDIKNNRHSLFSDDPQNGSVWGGIPQVAAIKGISFAFDLRTLAKFAADLQNDYRHQYTFIEPNYGNVKKGNYAGGSSQHPMDDVFGGENLIKFVYESIRNSPIWNSSLLVITYDEHGGFYDSVAPGSAQAPDDNSSTKYNQFGFDFTQYGVRVPAVIISPWVAAGVDSTVYDHSSVLATVEELFGLNPLTQRDKKAKDFTHLFLPTPRTDCPMTLNNPAAPVAAAQKSLSLQQDADVNAQPLPESGNEIGCLSIALKTDIELSSGDAAEIEAIIEKVKNIKTLGEADDYINAVMAKVDQLGTTGS